MPTRSSLGEKKLEELSNHVGGDAFIKDYYVTDDLEEAKKVARKAVAICKKYEFEHVTDDISITRQPECPNCDYFGGFSDVYCPKCGTKLTPAEEIDLE